MRALRLLVLLGLAACTEAKAGHAGARDLPDASNTPAAHPFSGAWAACEGATSAAECSRYLLLQRGDRICGTWSYSASGQAYDGRVVARATSSTEAQRTHVCGRPGSETSTECEDGWQRVDKPLRLCGGHLSDLAGVGGACFADYQPVPTHEHEREALLQQPWVQDCLSRDP